MWKVKWTDMRCISIVGSCSNLKWSDERCRLILASFINKEVVACSTRLNFYLSFWSYQKLFLEHV